MTNSDSEACGWQAHPVFSTAIYRDLDEDIGGGGEDIVAAYLKAARGRGDAIAAAITDGDAAAVKRTAHALKGSSRMLGVVRLAALCDLLETAAVRGEVLADCRQPVLDEVAAAIAALEDHLGQGPKSGP